MLINTRLTNKLWPLSVLALSGILIVTLQSKSLLKSRNADYPTSPYTLSTVQLTALKKLPTVGFRNIVADWSFIRFLQYFGDNEARQKTGYGDSSKYLSVAIHHDPYLRDFYVFLSGSSTLYAGNPEATIEVLSEGIAQLERRRAPDSYYVWRYKGTDELLFLNDGKAAQESFAMAAKWASESDDEFSDLIAQVSQQTAQFLANNPNSTLAQIDAWGSVLATALDDETRNRVISKIRELGGDVAISDDGQLQIKYSQSEDPIDQASSPAQPGSDS